MVNKINTLIQKATDINPQHKYNQQENRVINRTIETKNQ